MECGQGGAQDESNVIDCRRIPRGVERILDCLLLSEFLPSKSRTPETKSLFRVCFVPIKL